MLVSLNIQNFALIEKARLDFQSGFTVITGETGSGKSILLGALNLILGERTDYSVMRDKEKKMIVEAAFHVGNFDMEAFFTANDLDFSEETIVRREVTGQGKSRAFINDTPVSLALLKEFTENLVHIHSQHHTLQLKNMQFQLDVLDTLAGVKEQREKYAEKFLLLKRKRKEEKEKQAQLADKIKEADYNQFQLEELLQLNLEGNDFLKIEEDLRSLENIGEIQGGFSSIIQVMTEDQGVCDLLSSLKATLDKTKILHPGLSALAERVNSSLIELRDIADEAESGLEALETDPQKQQEFTEKLDAYNRLLRKHNVADQEELKKILEELSGSQMSMKDLEHEIENLNKEVRKLADEVENKAKDLHKIRIEKSPFIAAELQEILAELKLADTVVEFGLEQKELPDENGISTLTLYFSPNKGLDKKPIEKAASGGELSRFMLALQLMLSERKQLPTLLFDEIDTGVSGDVASKIGEVIRKMGKGMQVVAITHLPQVAAKGQHHLKVKKSSATGATLTEIVSLSRTESIEEIARLMSGEDINEAALEHARNLIG